MGYPSLLCPCGPVVRHLEQARRHWAGVGGVSVHETKAHATNCDIASGLPSEWQRAASGDADALAKLGANVHPVNDELDLVWYALQERAASVAKYVAASTARLGTLEPRDTEAKKARGETIARMPIMKVLPPTRMDRMWRLAPATDDGSVGHVLQIAQSERGR